MPQVNARNKGLGIRRKGSGRKQDYNAAYHQLGSSRNDRVVLALPDGMPELIVISDSGTLTMPPPSPLYLSNHSSPFFSDSSIDTTSTGCIDNDDDGFLNDDSKGDDSNDDDINKRDWEDEEKIRSAVLCLFKDKFGSPDESEWKGRGGGGV